MSKEGGGPTGELKLRRELPIGWPQMILWFVPRSRGTEHFSRAKTRARLCEGGECEEEILGPEVERIVVRGEGGLNPDISEPHAIRFRFSGGAEVAESGSDRTYELGKPRPGPEAPQGGVEVDSFQTSGLTLLNLPLREGAFAFDAPWENRRNHWYLPDRIGDVDSLDLPLELVEEVELINEHASLTKAEIKFSREAACRIDAKPKFVSERRVARCR
jgi:hypothetical protein